MGVFSLYHSRLIVPDLDYFRRLRLRARSAIPQSVVFVTYGIALQARSRKRQLRRPQVHSHRLNREANLVADHRGIRS